MKYLFTWLVLLFLIQTTAAQNCPVIPRPLKAEQRSGVFTVTSKTAVIADPSFPEPAVYLQQELLKKTGIAVPVLPDARGAAIKLKIRKGKSAEGYTLEVGPQEVVITAADPRGLHNGIASFMQLCTLGKVNGSAVEVQAWKITDEPKLEWRGFMLDESRHFFGKTKVKEILDWMAFYKLNRFHWHLTDQQGWRLAIEKYPRLGVVGGIGNFSDPNAPATYYTQEDIKEIVAYAAARYITVIPEIDMPGHATAANLAYPEFSGGGSPAYPEFTFNPGKKETYTYLTNILKEVDVLFPSQMIHLGGDEVHFGNQNWAHDAGVKQLMADNGLADLKVVEQHFIRRMADSTAALGNQVLAWDEVVEGNFPVDNTIVFWWRHDKPEVLKSALSKGYRTVLCPRLPLYFDFVQDSTHTRGRKWKSQEYNSLKNVYDFSPAAYVGAKHSKQLLGIQANLWTETIPGIPRLDYMLFPRITALAEAAWTSEENKDFDRFSESLKGHLGLFRKAGLYFYDPFAAAPAPQYEYAR